MTAIASAAAVAGSAARRVGGEWAAADVTDSLRSKFMLKQAPASYPAATRLSRRAKSHPRGLTRAGRPLYSARFAAPAPPRRPKAPVAELVDALDSKSSSARSAGSIPARGTSLRCCAASAWRATRVSTGATLTSTPAPQAVHHFRWWKGPEPSTYPYAEQDVPALRRAHSFRPGIRRTMTAVHPQKSHSLFRGGHAF